MSAPEHEGRPRGPPCVVLERSISRRQPVLPDVLVRVHPLLRGFLGLRSFLDREGHAVLILCGPLEVGQELECCRVLLLQLGAERLVEDVVGVVAVVADGLRIVERDVRALIVERRRSTSTRSYFVFAHCGVHQYIRMGSWFCTAVSSAESDASSLPL